MALNRHELGNAGSDQAREVEVAPDGTVREVAPVASPDDEPKPVKPTRLSPHTFGAL